MGFFNIFYDSDGLNEAKSQLESTRTDLEETVRQLSGLISRMEQTWTGDAAVEYINRLRQQLEELCRLEGMTDVLVQSANERICETQEVDNRFGAFIGALVNTIVSGVRRFLSVFGINT